MGRFENDLKLTVAVGNPRPFILDTPLAYRMGSGEVIEVPAGFGTDLASIPPGFRWRRLIGETARPGALHDYLYSHDGVRIAYRIGKVRSALEARKWADNLFFKALRSEGLPRSVCLIMWAAVRAFGMRRWSHARRAEPNRAV